MDVKNPYESPVTFKLHRAEYLVGFITTIVLLLIHITEIRWVPLIGLFLYIDVIGYIPGAIAYRRSGNGQISRVYYVMYNTLHSLITCAAVVGMWLWLIGPEWALLAVPFHVFGDRGVFGNFYKPFGLPFEPEDGPLYPHITTYLQDRSGGHKVPAEVAVVPADVLVRTKS